MRIEEFVVGEFCICKRKPEPDDIGMFGDPGWVPSGHDSYLGQNMRIDAVDLDYYYVTACGFAWHAAWLETVEQEKQEEQIDPNKCCNSIWGCDVCSPWWHKIS